MSNQAVQTRSESAVTATGAAGVKQVLAQEMFQKRFMEVLRDRAPQFMSSIITVAGSLPSDTEPVSIVMSSMVAATLDLPINKELGFAWIVPYWNSKKNRREAQFQMGHKGFIQLALRTNQYAGMNARAITKDAFGGYDSLGEPIIHWDKIKDGEPPVGYAFGWRMVSGFQKLCYWSAERVKAHAERYSQAYKKGWDCPWKSHFDEMALKTVIKNELSDWGMLSVQMQLARRADQAVPIDLESDAFVYPDSEADVVQLAESTGSPLPQLQGATQQSQPGVEAAAKTKTTAQKPKQPAAAPSNIVELKPADPQPAAAPKTEQQAPAAEVKAEAKAAESTQAPATTAAPAPAPSSPAQPAASQPATATPSPSTASAGASTAPTEQSQDPGPRAPKDWLPTLDPQDDAGTRNSLTEWMKLEGITAEELLSFARSRRMVLDNQTLAQAPIARIIGLLRNREVARKEIVSKRAK